MKRGGGGAEVWPETITDLTGDRSDSHVGMGMDKQHVSIRPSRGAVGASFTQHSFIH